MGGIVVNGGWIKVRKSEIVTERGFSFFLFWEVLLLLLLSISVWTNFIIDENFSLKAPISVLTYLQILAQPFMIYFLISRFGKKTRRYRVTYEEDVENSNCDPKNLY